MVNQRALGRSAELPHAGFDEYRPALRRLLTSPQLVQSGASVLVAGANPLPFVIALHELGFNADGACADAATVQYARLEFPIAEFGYWPSTARPPCPEQRYDVVLAIGVPDYAGNLLDSQARQATAGMLSGLRPGGRLVVLARSTVHGAASHGGDCWQRHLACFPGIAGADFISDHWLWPSGWNWGRGSAPPAGAWLISCRIPLEPLTYPEWSSYVRRGLQTDHGVCCRAITQTEPRTARRAA